MGPLIKYTDNLILKVVNENNSQSVLDLYNRNKSNFEQFEPTRPDNFYTNEFHKRVLIREKNAFMIGNFVRYYIFPKDNPNLIIGSVNFNGISNSPTKSSVIGYKLDSEYQGRGFAFEACHAAINVMIKEYGVTLFHAQIHPENYASLNLAKRLGFKYQYYEKNAANILGMPADLYHYTLIISMTQ